MGIVDLVWPILTYAPLVVGVSAFVVLAIHVSISFSVWMYQTRR